ncbi:acyltransferase [Stenotrophomonas sp. WHRI 8082]|uniref:acyltransferase n=1 Tax=Stenotrophomonas sp. WHRI 8082 TaxID=3162571 RepID=UPI0032EC06A8
MSFFTSIGSAFSLRFKLDDRIPLSYKIGLAIEHLFSLARGFLTFGVRKRLFTPVFRGRGASIRCGSLVSLGRGVRLGRFSLVDGLSSRGASLGDGAKLGDFSRIVCSGSLGNLGVGVVIGHRVGIGEYSRLGGSGGVFIGDDTIIGQYFSAHPENHNFLDKSTLIRLQGTERAEIVVGPNCWIGAKVTLLAGATIGHSSVVAAGSVVNSSFPPYSVIGGVPARLLKSY